MPYTTGTTQRCTIGYWPGTNRVRYAENCNQYTGVRTVWTESSRVEKEGPPPDVSGWRAPQPYSRKVVSANLWKGIVRSWAKYSLEDRMTTDAPYPYGNIQEFNYSFPISSVPQSLISQAEVQCLTKIKDKRCDYAVTVLETVESSNMVADRATTLFRAYRQTRKGKIAQAARTLGIRRPKSKEPEGAWLEMQLGWSPLLGEIHSLYETWRDGFRPDGLRLSAVSDRGVKVPPFFRIEPIGQPAQTYNDKGKYGCRVRLDYTLTSTALTAAAGMGLTNPATIIWELVPMSFVLDWFLPVGDWLNILDADFGLAFKGGSRTTYRKIQRIGSVFYAADTRSGFSYVNLKGSAQMMDMVRTVYTKTPIPVPAYYKLPTMLGQAITAFSLARVLT